MTEQNQGPTLEQRLLNLNAIHKTGREISKSEIEERPQLYSQLVTLLTGREPHQGTEADQNEYNQFYEAVSRNVEEATWHAQDGTENRVASIKPLYETQKSRLVREVLDSINRDTKDKSKAEAADILSRYLMGTFDTPEVDQFQIDKVAKKQLASRMGVSRNFTATGNPKDYENLHTRLHAAEYLEDIPNGYKLNEAKLSKLMDDVLMGATIYSNKFVLEKQKEANKNAPQKQYGSSQSRTF